MYAFVLFVLIIFINKPGVLVFNTHECPNVTKDNIKNICSNTVCLKNSSVSDFCEHLYETVFRCPFNYYIPLSLVCDGIKHCENGLDENKEACSYVKCCKNFYKCQDNQCINVSKVCNGIPNCRDGSDESSDMCRQVNDCGIITDEEISPLILNGLLIQPSLWPWYSALYLPNDDRWIFFCSSTIISSNIVITAAHCVWGISKDLIKVISGKRSSNYYLEEASTQTADILNTLIHPLYQDSLGNYASDIALIKLKQPFFFNEFVFPICINTTLRNLMMTMGDSLEGKVAGMGITENGTVSDELRMTKVQIIPNKDCIQTQRYEFRKFVTIGSFCAQGIAGGVVCNGDSGSGLAVQNPSSGKWFLEGIVSITSKNPNNILCDKNNYSIYTNVGMYSNWISEYLKADVI